MERRIISLVAMIVVVVACTAANSEEVKHHKAAYVVALNTIHFNGSRLPSVRGIALSGERIAIYQVTPWPRPDTRGVLTTREKAASKFASNTFTVDLFDAKTGSSIKHMDIPAPECPCSVSRIGTDQFLVRVTNSLKLYSPSFEAKSEYILPGEKSGQWEVVVSTDGKSVWAIYNGSNNASTSVLLLDSSLKPAKQMETEHIANITFATAHRAIATRRGERVLVDETGRVQDLDLPLLDKTRGCPTLITATETSVVYFQCNKASTGTPSSAMTHALPFKEQIGRIRVSSDHVAAELWKRQVFSFKDMPLSDAGIAVLDLTSPERLWIADLPDRTETVSFDIGSSGGVAVLSQDSLFFFTPDSSATN